MIDADSTNQSTGKGEPPHVLFRWGRFELEAVITDISQKMSLFMKDGTPVRTVVEISLQQVEDESQHAAKIPPPARALHPRPGRFILESVWISSPGKSMKIAPSGGASWTRMIFSIRCICIRDK